MIVFIGDSVFKTPMPESVTRGLGYIGFIKSKQDEVFTDIEIADIKAKIESFRLERGFSTNLQHRANLKSRFEGSQEVGAVGQNPYRFPKKFRFDDRKVFAVSCVVVGIGFLIIQVFRLINQTTDNLPKTQTPQISRSDSYSIRSNEVKKLSDTKKENKEKSSSFFVVDVQGAKEKLIAERSQKPIGINEDLFEIELLSGKKIYTKNARIEDGKVFFFADIGQEVGINMNDVVTVRLSGR